MSMDYVVAFPANLNALVAQKITASEMRVLLYIVQAMEWGNLIGFSQRAACAKLGMKKSNMSAVFKSLHNKGVLVKNEDGHMYVNSNLFAKGWGSSIAVTRDRLHRAAHTVEGVIAPAFDTAGGTAAPVAAASAPAATPPAAGQRRAMRPSQMRRADGSLRMPL